MSSIPLRPPAPGVEVGRTLAPVFGEGDREVVVNLWQLEVQHGLSKAVLGCGSGPSVAPKFVSLPRAQPDHPGLLDREALVAPELVSQARRLEAHARSGGHRIWLVCSPTLPFEEKVFPVFAEWRRVKVEYPTILAIDFLIPPEVEN